jgi:hypothetical protein
VAELREEGIDLVYTWVDDQWPGYADLLRAHAGTQHDVNPNRTRDNLELLRYSLRSVAHYMPWVRRIHLLTCRPQVPSWLDASHPKLSIVHHDQIVDAASLPTFSSFAIIAHLHLIPGVSKRFIYMEDDMLIRAQVGIGDFFDKDGRVRVYPRLGRTAPAALRDDSRVSPWNAALARANHLLDTRFGHSRRRTVNHVPLPVDRELWRAMLDEWPEAAQHTRTSRFRRVGNIPPEYLYPHYALAVGRGVAWPLARTYRDSFYFPLENRPWQIRLQGGIAARLRPKFVTMNDNFDERPDAAVVSYVRRMLERWFPLPGPLEKFPAAPASTRPESLRASH